LDWGCGKGHSTYLLNKLGVKIQSCDIISDEEDSAFGQETPIIKSCDINVIPLNHEYLLPFDDNSFDVVLSMGVLEHVQNDSLSLKEIYRILNKGSLFFCFFLPQRFSWTQFISKRMGDNYHDRLYTRTNVERLLKNADFEIKDFWHRQLFPKNTVKYFSPHFFEMVDQSLVKYTPLKYLATNVEFVAQK
jgi:SAM-dependent methyltransferase